METNSPAPKEPIKHLFKQIRKLTELHKQAKSVDNILMSHLENIKGTASEFIEQIGEEKKLLLKRFDKWIMPIAQEVLDELVDDASDLKTSLEKKLANLDPDNPIDWEEEAKRWIQLHSRLTDKSGIVKRILHVVSERTKQQIDKDIQVIKDYQTQSLANISQEGDENKNLEERLSHAIAEPLKQLKDLGKEAEAYNSIQQASSWVANLQEKRQSSFDDLLRIIDHVMKDVVHKEETSDWFAFVETEGEIIFMERELHQINEDIAKLQRGDEAEVQMLCARLEGLLDHFEDLDQQEFPGPLQMKMDALKSGIMLSFEKLESQNL